MGLGAWPGQILPQAAFCMAEEINSCALLSESGPVFDETPNPT